MARVTPEEFADKYARRLKGSISDIKAGVERVTESPTEKAARKADKMKARLVESIDSGKWQAGLKRVTLDEWKDKMINKGLNRISAGVDASKGKVTEFASQLLPHIDAGVEKIKNMPDLTLEDSINRMSEFIRHMSKFRKH